MTRSAIVALALMTLTAAPAFAEATTNAITANALANNALTNNALTNNALTNNALTNNALTNNGINRSLRAGAGSVLDVIALQLPGGGPTLSK